MNHATRFTKLALLLIVAGALALAGCGGDDGVAQSVHDQALAERDAAMTAQERPRHRLLMLPRPAAAELPRRSPHAGRS